MQRDGSGIRLSASDLANHLSCSHLTQLERRRVAGEIQPPHFRDLNVEHLQQLGFAHEEAYLDHLRTTRGLESQRCDPEDNTDQSAVAMMRMGVGVVVQASLGAGSVGAWHGRADILLRCDTPSDLGDWSYEVVDTKLARETRAETILQLCLYSELVAEIQGLMPARMGVVSPESAFQPVWYRPEDYLAYYRRTKDSLRAALQTEVVQTYPEPVSRCETCRWWPDCNRRWRDDDHLSLVAGMGRSQRRELVEQGVGDVAALAALPDLLPFRPSRGAADTYRRLRDQARVQVDGRRKGEAVIELLELLPAQGLGRLPAPSPGDLFFDIEGDHFVGDGGIEYLLGVWFLDEVGQACYRSFWGLDRAGERKAFVEFVEFVEARRANYADLHVYHYDHYEPTAIKRLMGRYAACEEQVDDWLRNHLFVDMHRVVRETLIASVERYSLKDLEAFYRFERAVSLDRAGASRGHLERLLELHRDGDITADLRQTVQAYNADDCASTAALRDWLERLRDGLLADGVDMPRPELAPHETNEEFDERRRRVLELIDRLTAGVPFEAEQRTQAQHARWLLAHCLDYYRREDKVGFWEKFRLLDLGKEAHRTEAHALGDLDFVQELPLQGRQRTVTHRYRFPPQECVIRPGGELWLPDGDRFGAVVDIDHDGGVVDIKKTKAATQLHPAHIVEWSHFRSGVLADAVERAAQWVVADTATRPDGDDLQANGPYRSVIDLLLRSAPRLTDASAFDGGLPAASLVDETKRIVRGLDRTMLPVQGPPGSGKTYLGGRLITDLVRAGKTVGVCANSHAVIRHLLEAVVAAGTEERVAVVCGAKPGNAGDLEGSAIVEFRDNAGPLRAVECGEVQVVGGTKYMWSREEFAAAVDVLFIDEASQLSLADAIAVAHAANSVVMLGDPRQLEQPQQGSHPPGVDVSPLDHLLDGNTTLPPQNGIFMPQTRRLHPSLCRYTSELFYEGKLAPLPELAQQRLAGSVAFDGAGLFFVPVEHQGNQSSSVEEVTVVSQLLDGLTRGVTWVNQDGRQAPLTPADVLVITPYNAQVSLLHKALGYARIGTVDRFQGQEAAVVIYSMATSTGADAPRGMEFLYSANRLNVATSRARCAVILVGNPQLFEIDCRTPEQMRLANAFCRFIEIARPVTTSAIRRRPSNELVQLEMDWSA